MTKAKAHGGGAQAPGRGMPAAHARAAWLRENIEAIVIAIILALLIKQFAMEAFVIPTGSMAPTLLGAHVDVTCPNCSYEQPMSASLVDRTHAGPNAVGRCPSCGRSIRANLAEDAFTMRDGLRTVCDGCGAIVPLRPLATRPGGGVAGVQCGNCRVRFDVELDAGRWPFGSISRGDRILVNKFVYRFREPQRNEIVVFKYPRDPSENFIKRLVGLPGETLDIRRGDLYVDGRVAPKPIDVQEAIWLLVHDTRYPEKRSGAGEPRGMAWRGQSGEWRTLEGGEVTADPGEGGIAWLRFMRPISDRNVYNVVDRTDGDEQPRDVRLGFTARLGEGATLLAQLQSGAEAVDLELTRERAVVRWGGRLIGEAPLSLGEADAIEGVLWRADQQAVLRIGGETVIALPLGDGAPPLPEADGEESAPSSVRIGARGGALNLTRLSVHRDIYYLRHLKTMSTVRFPYTLEADEFFVLGDNSSNSTDSRRWGVVPRGHLVGRAFLVFWPALPGDFAVRRIR